MKNNYKEVSDKNRTEATMASNSQGEEVAITGMAGCFPDSENVYHLRDSLFNKVDLISDDNRRWEPFHPDIPQKNGKIRDITKFDAGFFGINYRHAHAMDPTCRIILEKALEAVLDAGVQPLELRGTRTGVFVAACLSESQKTWFFERLLPDYNAVTGCSRSMVANRISYYFGLQGPSFTIDSACSSSLYALDYAYRAIRRGDCDAAIVGGTNTCLDPMLVLQYAHLGVLSLDGSCKSFDKSRNGYVKSEAIVAIFLQKTKDSRRIYAEIVHTKTNCDGFKERSITHPSAAMQKQLFDELYNECNVIPTTIDFLEAHATGTRVGDPQELSSLDQIFCKGRSTPLLVGSVKSNLGHTETASGLCSIVKVLIGMESGYIPPNIHYSEPVEGCEALKEHRMEVVTEKTPWIFRTGLAGVNNFGFGGTNCHVLLRYNDKDKVNSGQPEDELPRLVCLSGRTENSVNAIIDDLTGRKLDTEYVALLNEAFKDHIPGFKYKAFTVISKNGEIKSEIRHYDERKRLLYFIFSTPISKWSEIARELYILPPFETTLHRVHDILSQKGISIIDIIMNEKIDTSERLVTLGSLVVQIGVVELLKVTGIKPDFVIGLSLGELLRAYSEDAFTLEQTILCAYSVLYTNNINKTTCSTIKENLQEIIPLNARSSEKWTALLSLDPKSLTEHHISSEELNRTAKSLKRNSVVLKISDEGVTKGLPKGLQDDEVDVIQIFNNHKTDYVLQFLKTLGQLHNFGMAPKIQKLYPPVQYPVSRGTPMISPLLKWEHTEDWHVSFYKRSDYSTTGVRTVLLNVNDVKWSFLKGHVINGRNLFPATAYLNMVWETLAMVHSMLMTDMQVIFENVKFTKTVIIPKEGKLKMGISIQKGSGNFEVTEGDATVVTGRISTVADISKELVQLPIPAVTIDKYLLPLKAKDVYKELHLRGYTYRGVFRAIQECDNTATRGIIHWTDNYITFMDSMLQLLILQTNTRNCLVPVGIERLIIDARRHTLLLQNVGEEQNFPVYVYKEANTVKSGGIEIRGIRATSISRQKPLGEPVLETYKFVPNEAHLTIFESITVIMQLILENNYGIKIKVVELLDDLAKEDAELLTPTIHTVLSNQPLTRSEMLILSKKKFTVQKFKVEDRTLDSETNCTLVVATNLFSRPQVIQDAFKALKGNGFLLSREDLNFESSVVNLEHLEVIVKHSTATEKLILLRRRFSDQSIPVTVEISHISKSFDWLPKLQEAIKTDRPVIVYSQNNLLSGILGLVNCIRREPRGENIRCVFLMDKAPPFDVNDEMYQKQLKKKLTINIYKHGKWGTYRHLLLQENTLVETKNCYINMLTRGDLSSMRWIETAPESKSVDSEKTIVHIYYSSLNFRDVMTATGRLTTDELTYHRLDQEWVQGFEYAGRDERGRRLMGISNGALAISTIADTYFTWPVPDKWTLEEAATVPVVYCTVLYALIKIGNIQPGDTILIHAGSGGIGQAAINIALYHGCIIFTTVGTKEKREFVKNKYPQIKDSHIGNSRDITFEQMILTETDGRGVDIILNSLSEEKLLVSVRCLAHGGKFLEIGSFDLANNNDVRSQTFLGGRSYHGIMLNSLFSAEPSIKYYEWKLLQDYIDNGAVTPLPTTVFSEDEVEQAYRFMAVGKHIGKVLVKIRDEEKEEVIAPSTKTKKAVPRYYCDPNYSYVILGGLGGFGLELADWLILRGARNLVLTSRTGIKNGYQALRIRVWRSYGVIVNISTADISTEQGCSDLLSEANKLAPVHAIFNSAVILKEAILENQTVETFVTSFEPKAYATMHLDKVSRKLCPHLRDFVVFSSIFCGRGNPGATNYGMANSVMERICEKRRSEGYPALAIQWGAIGGVGVVADMQEDNKQLEIVGTLPQSIFSCLEALDIFLKQSEMIAASMVVVEKRGDSKGGASGIVDAILNILGNRDLKLISLHSTLAELGMDSIMAVEIRQTLEREFDVFLTARDTRNMTLARLQEIVEEKGKGRLGAQVEVNTKTDKLKEPMKMLFTDIGDETHADIPLVRMKSLVEEDRIASKVFFVPGLEGINTAVATLAANLSAHIFCLQFRYGNSNDSVFDIAKDLLPYMLENLPNRIPFTIIAYSFGCLVTLEMVNLLEKEGRTGRVILIDGAPDFLSALAKQQFRVDSEAEFETDLLCNMMSLYMPLKAITKLKGTIRVCNNFEERLQVVIDNSPKDIPHSQEYLRLACKGVHQRLRSLINYKPLFIKLKSSIQLFRPLQTFLLHVEEDYGLSKICEDKVEVKFFEGNHVTILKNLEVSKAINEICKYNEGFLKTTGFNDYHIQTVERISIS